MVRGEERVKAYGGFPFLPRVTSDCRAILIFRLRLVLGSWGPNQRGKSTKVA